jgi:peptidyl-tRNA hydrolase, PTH1 family
VPADWLVVGLGNPGTEYAGTRHNSGADTVELLARRHGTALKRGPRGVAAVTASVHLGEATVVLAVPQTFYNESGLAVAGLCRWHHVDDADHIVVVHDELDLPPGRLKVKEGGGLAGNNGLKSIKAHLRTTDFLRVRIGVGKPPGRMQGADHVLRRPGKAERVELDIAIEEAADAVELIVTSGVERAMDRFNQRDNGPDLDADPA